MLSLPVIETASYLGLKFSKLQSQYTLTALEYEVIASKCAEMVAGQFLGNCDTASYGFKSHHL